MMGSLFYKRTVGLAGGTMEVKILFYILGSFVVCVYMKCIHTAPEFS